MCIVVFWLFPLNKARSTPSLAENAGEDKDDAEEEGDEEEE